MPNNLTDTEENRILDAVMGTAAYTAPTTPLKLRLMTNATTPTDSTAGTQVSGGTYAAQTITFGAASGGSVANNTLIRFEGLPATTVAHIEIWDSAGTPRRLWYAPLSSSVTVTANQPLEFAVGSITFTLD